MYLGTRLALLGGILVLTLFSTVSGNFVFPVQHKFKGKERSLSALKNHDIRRHARILSAVDLELGGNSLPSESGSVCFFFIFPCCMYLQFRFSLSGID